MQELTEEQQKALEEKIKSMSPEELQEFQKQQCIFCQIIAGKIPSKKVYEDELLYGVLDINPAAKGHILLLPKEHYAIMPQVPDAVIGHLFLVSKYLSQIILKTLKVTGTNVFIANGQAAGQRSQHFLLHVIPRKEADHILDVTDKLIPAELQQKVKAVVEPKLNQILGIKKKELPRQDRPEIDRPEIEQKPHSEDEASTGKKSQKNKISPVSKHETSPTSRKKSTPKIPAKKASANLDDIASLFK